jgi:hypothetical protein
MIGRLSMATGVPVADIKPAWELEGAGYGGAPPSRRPIADQGAVPRSHPMPHLPLRNRGSTAWGYERRSGRFGRAMKSLSVPPPFRPG